MDFVCSVIVCVRHLVSHLHVCLSFIFFAFSSAQHCESAECPNCKLATLYFALTEAELKAEQDKLDAEYENRNGKQRAKTKVRKSTAQNPVQCMATAMSCYGEADGGNCPHCRDLAKNGLLAQVQTPNDVSSPCSCKFCKETCTFGPFRLSQMANLLRDIADANSNSNGGANSNSNGGGFSALMEGLQNSHARGLQSLTLQGVADPSYDEQCGATADILTEFDFDSTADQNAIRTEMGNPTRERANGERINPPTAGPGHRYYANSLSQSGTGPARSIGSIQRTQQQQQQQQARHGPGMSVGQAGQGTAVSGANSTNHPPPPPQLPVRHPPPPQPLAQPQPPTNQPQQANGTPSQGRAKRMIKVCKRAAKDPSLGSNKKRTYGIVKRDLHNRENLAYNMAKDAPDTALKDSDDEGGGEKKTESQEWVEEAVEEYEEREEEEMRKARMP